MFVCPHNDKCRAVRWRGLSTSMAQTLHAYLHTLGVAKPHDDVHAHGAHGGVDFTMEVCVEPTNSTTSGLWQYVGLVHDTNACVVVQVRHGHNVLAEKTLRKKKLLIAVRGALFDAKKKMLLAHAVENAPDAPDAPDTLDTLDDETDVVQSSAAQDDIAVPDTIPDTIPDTVPSAPIRRRQAL